MIVYLVWPLGNKVITRSRDGGGARRMLMTDESREEIAQAAAATSEAYAVGARNLSTAFSVTDNAGT